MLQWRGFDHKGGKWNSLVGTPGRRYVLYTDGSGARLDATLAAYGPLKGASNDPLKDRFKGPVPGKGRARATINRSIHFKYGSSAVSAKLVRVRKQWVLQGAPAASLAAAMHAVCMAFAARGGALSAPASLARATCSHRQRQACRPSEGGPPGRRGHPASDTLQGACRATATIGRLHLMLEVSCTGCLSTHLFTTACSRAQGGIPRGVLIATPYLLIRVDQKGPTRPAHLADRKTYPDWLDT